jgi:hypothetical protein
METLLMVGAIRRDVDRETSRYSLPEYRWASVDAFLEAGALSSGVHSIMADGEVIDILLERGSTGAPTLVQFHAALPQQPHNVPVFVGRGVSRSLDVNRIYVSDPSLALDQRLKLAWFTGSSRLNLQAILPRLIGALQKSLGGGRLVFAGSSGGGFASLYYSHGFPGSLCIATNPQTAIERYTIKSVTNTYLDLCWGANDDLARAASLANDFQSDVSALYSGGNENTVLYLQNLQDSHVDEHLNPFLEAVAERKAVFLNLEGWGAGHVPPEKWFTTTILEWMTGDDYMTVLRERNFINAPTVETVNAVRDRWYRRNPDSK